MKDLFIPSVITSLEDLPNRIKGQGYRADEYSALSTDVEIAILNDEEFNIVVEHNAKRMFGPECNVITIYNEGEGSMVVIRASAILSNPH